MNPWACGPRKAFRAGTSLHRPFLAVPSLHVFVAGRLPHPRRPVITRPSPAVGHPATRPRT